ncbi:integrase core domain-containing protein [Actinospica robiniae]|uniref:integrase core domain-containing protein n=1 Tax=Actinospica robiniae TaxID=304901 RepID=UPI0009FDB84B
MCAALDPASRQGPDPADSRRESLPGNERIAGELVKPGHRIAKPTSGSGTAPDSSPRHSCGLEDCGLRVLRSPPQSPRANAVCERLVGTLRREVLDHLLILNEAHLRAFLAEYTAHYNAARLHQGIGRHVPNDDPDHPKRRSSTWRPRESVENESLAVLSANIG